MKRVSLVILVLLILILGCGGGSKANIVAYCQDGTKEYNLNCQFACASHGGILDWGPKGAICARNPP